ncbi:FMRFamide receptor [Aplysia californica]|uniref:FMRFamide receptor n=1 Tax=Aplysia californica TaxID=6500 RepID=A0ABM0JLD8_APLCA|nr:FMRFamide receptor [Aplysia californica]
MENSSEFANISGIFSNSTEAYPTSTEAYLKGAGNLVDKICSPIIYVIGFPGNTVSLIIWMQKRMRHSSGYYLAALALNDLVFLFLQVLFELETAWLMRVISYPVMCQVFPTVYLATQCLSPYLVLAFTTERYISICHPFKRESYCTVRRAKIVIACLIVFCLCTTCVNSYFYILLPVNGTSVYECHPRMEVLEGENKSVFNVYSMCVEGLAFFLVPITILVLNIFVIREMRRLSQMEQAHQHGSPSRTGSTTVMLLAVSFYQIITTLPVSIFYALRVQYQMDPVYYFAQTIINEYGNTHYAFNIFIYLITGKMFRQELKKLLLRPFRKLASTLPRDYSSLRTSIQASTKSKGTWVSINGKHNNGEKKEEKASETLL